MKKIIAREFLFVLGYAVLVGLIYCVVLLLQYTNKEKTEELSRQANILTDFQPYKYRASFSEGDTSVYDDFKELYFDLRSYGITDIDESEFDIFAKFNCSAYGRNNKSMDEKILKIIELMEAAGESEQSIVDVVSVYEIKNKSSEVIKDLFKRATSLGYKKGIEDFKNLLSSDDEVLQDNFNYVKENGYSKGIEQFSSLIGIGQVKKEDLYEEDLYELMKDGAFSNKEEFSDFISVATQKEIYSLVTEGAFESFEEFNSIFNDSSVKEKEDTEDQYNQLSDFYTSAKIKLNNEIIRVRRKNPFEYFGILVLSLFSLIFLLRYLLYSALWSVKQLKN